MLKIQIQTNDFDINQEIKTLKTTSDIGAVVSFVGFVRDVASDNIDKMTLEHYPTMSENALENIAKKAQNRWELSGITIIHRVGDLKVDEQIVLVITTSKHRKDAFNSCEFIMDYLKTDAPFWKKEYKKSGAKWVTANDKDNKAKTKWQS
jgi:molybdopterin synthase catalytic subunit